MAVAIRRAAVLVAASIASPAPDDAAPPIGAPLAFEIRAGDARLEDRGPSRRFRCVADFEGTLHVFALAPQRDAFLRIEDADGDLLAEDDDAGGGTTPYLEREVEAGDALTIVVALKGQDASGQVELRLESSPESEATREAAADANRRVRAVEGDPSLTPAGAREAIRAVFEDLAGVDGGARSRAVADALWHLGGDAYTLGDLATARDAWAVCRERAERVFPPDFAKLQAIRGNLGVAYEELEDLEHARVLKDLAFAALSRTLPDDHESLQIARLQRAVLLQKLGRDDEALPLQRIAIEHLSRTRPPDDPTLLKARSAMGISLRSLGDFAGARGIHEDVLAIRSRAAGVEDPEVQLSRLDLGTTLCECGELEQARWLHESVLAVRERTLPPDHPWLAAMRCVLAVTLGLIGDLDGSRAQLERAIATYEKQLPPDATALVKARANLATTRMLQGDPEGARKILEDVLAILERTREGDPDVELARAQLGSALSSLGRFEEARILQESVDAAWTRRFPPDYPDLLSHRLNLALTLKRLGRLEPARELARGALDVRLRVLRRGDPMLQRNRSMVFVLEAMLGNVAEAERLATELAADAAAGVGDAVLVLSPREVEQVALNRAAAIDLVLSFAVRLDDAKRRQRLEELAWTLMETVRSAAATSTRVARAAASGSGSAEIAAVRAEIAAARRDVARHSARPGSQDRVVDAAARLDAGEKRLRSLLAGTIRFDPPAAGAVAAALPSDAVAVTYWRTTLADLAAGEDEHSAPRHLFAFVLRPGAAPAAVDLGLLEPVAAAADAWRRAIRVDRGRGRRVATDAPISAPESSDRDALESAGVALRRLVFDPLRPAIGAARRAILVPDDVLHLVPLDALPDGDALLGDRFAIETRSSLADLAGGNREEPRDGALGLVGGIEFGAADSADSFPPLPETAGEIDAIGALWRTTAGEAAAIEVLSGADATKSKLIELAPRARFLHLATHGEFRTAASTARDAELAERVKGFAPLTLCGLALAGANAPPDALGQRDGIITGEEIAVLDLGDCELAVLSACETNLGENRAGQGVASLEAALSAAGARTTITSLWRVPDAATRELMTDFYRRIWVGKEPKARALWSAKRDLREKGARVADWAGWVLTGDPE